MYVKELCSSEREGRTSQPESALEVRGFEPLTYGLQSHRSSQLSYTPMETRERKDASVDGPGNVSCRSQGGALRDFIQRRCSIVSSGCLYAIKRFPAIL